MSLTYKKTSTVNPNWLASATGWVKKTRNIPQSMGESDSGMTIVKSGTVYPANDTTAIGIVTEDVDVTYGDKPGSVTIQARVYDAQLPVALSTEAKTALEAKGFHFDEYPVFG